MTQQIRLDEKTLMFFWWAGGVGFFVLFFIALWPMMGMIVPPDPAWSSERLVEEISSRLTLYKLGAMVGIVASGLLSLWTVMASYHVYRAEEGRPPLLAATCLGAGLINVFGFMLPFVLWAGGSYRIGFGQDPDYVRYINDMAWLIFVMLFQPFVILLMCLSFAGLNSTSSVSTFPRWFCYYSLWIALLMCGGAVAILFKDGPFAWNGLIAWWMVVVMFGIYFITALGVFYRLNKQSNTSSADFAGQQATT